MKRIRNDARCPWCGHPFGEDQKKEFWAHVYDKHQLSSDDVLFEVCLELDSVRERLQQIEQMLLEAKPRRVPEKLVVWRQSSIMEIPERHPESYY